MSPSRTSGQLWKAEFQWCGSAVKQLKCWWTSQDPFNPRQEPAKQFLAFDSVVWASDVRFSSAAFRANLNSTFFVFAVANYQQFSGYMLVRESSVRTQVHCSCLILQKCVCNDMRATSYHKIPNGLEPPKRLDSLS